MPSYYATAAAALALASTAAAQVSGPDLNTTCPNPDKTCQSFPVDFSNGGTYFQDVDLSTSFNFSSYYTGCQSNAYSNNFLVFPDGHQLECSNTTIGTDGTIVTAICPVSQSDLPSGLYSLIMFSNNGRKCAGLTAQRNIRINVGKQETLIVTPQVVFTSTSTPIATKSQTSTITSEFYAPTPTVTSTKQVANPTRTFTPATSWTTTTTTANTKTLTYYDLLVYPSIITKQAHCKITAAPVADSSVALSPEPTPYNTAIPDPAPYSNNTVNGDVNDADDDDSSIPEDSDDSSDDAVVTVEGDDSSDDSTPDSVSTITKRAVRNIMDDIREHLADFMAARVQNVGNHAKRAPEQATLTSIITDVTMFSTIITTKTAPTVTTTETSLVTTSTTSTPFPVTLYKNPVTTITLATPTGTKTRTIKMVTTWTTLTKYKTVKIRTTVTPTKKAAKCSAKGGQMI